MSAEYLALRQRDTVMKKHFRYLISVFVFLLFSFVCICTFWPHRLIRPETAYDTVKWSVSRGEEVQILTETEKSQLFDHLRDIRFIKVTNLSSFQRTEDTIEIEIYYYKLIITEEDAYILDELKQLLEEISPNPYLERKITHISDYYPVVFCDDSLAQIWDLLIK